VSAPRRRAPIIAGIVGVAVLALVVLFVVSPKGDTKEEASPLLGKLAPQLVGTTIDGDTFDLDSQRGEWVLVNFFATWCPPCVLEHPELVKLSSDDAGSLQVVSVASGDTEENVVKFFSEKGGNWPVIAADTGAVSLDYGVKKLPESYLIAPDGTVVAKFLGGITAAELEKYITRSTTSSSGS
jgi:cytochrome c biogenesis protein CcmG, thiol:disulfide interchange protein DsbE